MIPVINLRMIFFDIEIFVDAFDYFSGNECFNPRGKSSHKSRRIYRIRGFVIYKSIIL